MSVSFLRNKYVAGPFCALPSKPRGFGCSQVWHSTAEDIFTGNLTRQYIQLPSRNTFASP